MASTILWSTRTVIRSDIGHPQIVHCANLYPLPALAGNTRGCRSRNHGSPPVTAGDLSDPRNTTNGFRAVREIWLLAEWRRPQSRVSWQPMSKWLQYLAVVLIVSLAGLASAGDVGYGSHSAPPSIDVVANWQPAAQCEECLGYEAATCTEACAGSLHPEHQAGMAFSGGTDVFPRSLEDDLLEGRRSPPRLTPPIA